jgi:hypothetical protein
MDVDMEEVQLNYDNAGIPEASNDTMQDLIDEQTRLNDNLLRETNAKNRNKYEVDLANNTKQVLDAFSIFTWHCRFRCIESI